MNFHAWIIVLLYTVSHTYACYVLFEPFELKHNKKIVISIIAICVFLLHLLRAYFSISMPYFPVQYIFYLLILPVFIFSVMKLLCNGKTLVFVMLITLIYALSALSQMLMIYVYYYLFGDYPVLSFTEIGSTYAGVLAFAFEIIAYTVFLLLWRYRIGKITSDLPNMKIIIVIISGQLIFSLNAVLSHIEQRPESQAVTALSLFVMIVGNIAILQVLLMLVKKTETEIELSHLTNERKLEQMHFTMLNERQHEIAKIQHDFNNQLVTAYRLFLSNKKSHAKKQLHELELSIKAANSSVYCENAVVNAVLNENQRKCNDADITLDAKVAIAEDCGISSNHICSIFSNLLDNAIFACKSLPSIERTIKIRTAYSGDYLHIKCTNPFDGNVRKKGKKGFGHLILSDIASEYDGYFTTETSDGLYIAMIYLRQ